MSAHTAKAARLLDEAAELIEEASRQTLRWAALGHLGQDDHAYSSEWREPKSRGSRVALSQDLDTALAQVMSLRWRITGTTK